MVLPSRGRPPQRTRTEESRGTFRWLLGHHGTAGITSTASSTSATQSRLDILPPTPWTLANPCVCLLHSVVSLYLHTTSLPLFDSLDCLIRINVFQEKPTLPCVSFIVIARSQIDSIGQHRRMRVFFLRPHYSSSVVKGKRTQKTAQQPATKHFLYPLDDQRRWKTPLFLLVSLSSR